MGLVANPLVLFPVVPGVASASIRIANAAAAVEDRAVSFASATEALWSSGDGLVTTNERDLSQIVLNALNGNTLGLTWARTVSGTTHRFTFTVTPDGRLLWGDAATTFDPLLLGFTAASTALGPTHAAPNAPDGTWIPARPWTLDSRLEPLLVGGLARALDGTTRAYQVGNLKERTVRWSRLPRTKVLTEYLATTEPRSSLQRAFELAASRWLRIYDDEANHGGASSTYKRMSFRDFARPWSLREGEPGTRYDAELHLAEFKP